ncbi:MAG TPA: hypothetical protein DDZ42_18145 [Candidatus Rokubacteria bacterium]|nr:MAG: hypothetical protein A2050_01470 [Candidatus Rokubacteria bacterium GWA2_73_35]HBH03807.1 hypothetical protein [Candidatus Rokubacteria bacterium]
MSRATPAADAAPDAVTPDAPRVLIADARAAARSVLEPLLRRDGLEVCAVASSFDVLRTLRDQPVSLILIDPELPGGGVSGVDVVRTLKGSTRFRRLPALFLLAGPQPVPAGLADGALSLDTMSDETLLAAVHGALGAPPAGPGAAPAAGNGRAPLDAEAIREAVARCCREELRDAVLEAVREVARDVVPAVAERLIREEIERLRARHGLDRGPSDTGGVS